MFMLLVGWYEQEADPVHAGWAGDGGEQRH